MENDNPNIPLPPTHLQLPKKWYQHKGLWAILILTVIAAGVGTLYYIKQPKPDLSPIVVNHKKEDGQFKDWTAFKFETYGFEFKLPQDWEYTNFGYDNEEQATELDFFPKDAEYGTRPENYGLTILISNHAIDLEAIAVAEKEKLERITVDGRPASVTYGYPEWKEDPTALISLEDRSLVIMPNRESAFSVDTSFKELLNTFKFFKPYGTINSSQPVKKEPITDKGAWCAKSPEPAHCYAEIARTESNVSASWCEAIKPENSGDIGDSHAWYYSYTNTCYKYVAPKLKDISLCDRMIGKEQFEINKILDTKNCKSWMYYELAVQNNDPSYCSKMDASVFIYDGYMKDSVTQGDCYKKLNAK